MVSRLLAGRSARSRPVSSCPPPRLEAATVTRIQALSTSEYARLWADLEADDRPAVLRARCRTDRALFARAFFPDRFDLDFSPVHLEFLSIPKASWRERRAQTRLCRVAPRGGAKSSMRSFLEIVHDVVYGLEVCVLLFSTGFQLSEDLVKDLHAVFSLPSLAPELHDVYGPFVVVGTQTSFVVHVPGGEPAGTQVAAKSFGSGSTRGHKHAGRRPSKMVFDDTVNPKHVKNAEQRDEAWKYLTRDAEKAGFSYTTYELVGTIQHPDDLVARVAASPAWQAVTWKNLVSWPARSDLWEECRRLWADLSDPARVETALAFYVAHRAEMDAGAEVLWPAGRPLWDLMCAYWQDEPAFWAEDQNQPRDSSRALFDLSRVRRCRYDGREIHTSRGTVVPLDSCRVAIWLDPSSGGARSDYPAIAVVAADRDGWRYVLRVSLHRRQPSAQHSALWATWAEFADRRPQVGMDATGTQGLLGEAMERARDERRRGGLAWNMPVEAVTLTEDKESRIAGLEPLLHHGWMELASDLPAEVDHELRDHPGAAHDDALDAIERADWLLSRHMPIVTASRGLGG